MSKLVEKLKEHIQSAEAWDCGTMIMGRHLGKELLAHIERLEANQERGKVLAEKLRMVNISFASAGNPEHVETLREIYDFLKATHKLHLTVNSAESGESNLLGGAG